MPAFRITSWLIHASMMALAIGINLLPILLTSWSLEWGGPEGLRKEQLGRIGSSIFAGLILGLVIGGPLADRHGARWFVVGGNGLLALGLGLISISPGYGILLMAVFIVGIGTGLLDMILSPLIAEMYPHKRSSAMNWLHSFYCLGAILTIAFALVILSWLSDWRMVTLLLALPPLLLAVFFLLVPLPQIHGGDLPRAPFLKLVRRPFFLAALVAMMLAGAIELGVSQWLPAFLEFSHGQSTQTGALALAGFSLAMWLGRVGAGLAGPKVSEWKWLGIGSALSIAGYAAVGLSPWPVGAILAGLLLGLAISWLWPTTLAVASNHYPNGGATLFAAMAIFGNFGGVLFPWMIGLGADLAGLRFSLGAMFLAPVALLFLVGWMHRRAATGPVSVAYH